MKQNGSSPCAQWEAGDTAQRRWALLLADSGRLVLPAYKFTDVDPATKAPVLLGAHDVFITPDVLSLGKKMAWHEVKSKTIPTWYRKLNRWEHGCDYAAAREYQEVQARTGISVLIVVHEIKSPPNSFAFCRPGEMVSSGIWLLIRLCTAFEIGERRRDWPGGAAEPSRRGRGGMGGLLWPRSAMIQWHPEGESVQ